MKKIVVSKELLQLLVKVYNRPIQYYYYFPDVIICDHQRLERSEFELLLAEDLIASYYADSFGKIYQLSQKAELILLQQLPRKKYKTYNRILQSQACFSF